jgi:hypothetical protein
MVSISSCLRRIKQNALSFPDGCQINRLCDAAGYRPRDTGPMSPVNPIALFMQQVLPGKRRRDRYARMTKPREKMREEIRNAQA